jgi:glutamate formiminotransferase / formiminotetrahydrofolate cyclodeaminase
MLISFNFTCTVKLRYPSFQVIDAISDAIRNVAGVELLDVDAGQSTNRTVYTFVGGPEAIIEGALAAAKAAFPIIDMTKHKGKCIIAYVCL